MVFDNNNPYYELPFNRPYANKQEKPFICDWGRVQWDDSVNCIIGIKAIVFIYFDARCQSEWIEPWYNFIGLN